MSASHMVTLEKGHARHVSTIKNGSTTRLPQHPGQLWHIVHIKNMCLHGG